MGACALLVSATAARAAGPDPVVVGHRGASGYAPENTLQAVDKAHDLGITWVENDVQRTKDGKLVVIHDTDLKRTTDVEEVFPGRAPWNVGDFTAAEIARLDAGSWKGAAFAGTRIPTLRQYLHRVEANGQNLLMEVKAPELYPGIEREIIGELALDGWLDQDHVNGRLVVQSFNADSVRTVHTLAPSVRTGFLGTPAVADLPRYAAFADEINPDYTSVSSNYVKAVHKVDGTHGGPMEVYAWTVNTAAAAKRVAGYGVDGIISNYPDVVRTALGQKSGTGEEIQENTGDHQDARQTGASYGEVPAGRP